MRGSVSALAAVEIRRLLLHPLLIGGVVLSAVAIASATAREGQLQAFLLMGVAVLPLATAPDVPD